MEVSTVKYMLLLSIGICLRAPTVSSADCTGDVTANLAVTGAFTKYNGTYYTVNSNEYATFTCTGNADTGVEVESVLEVKCSGSSDREIKSSAGTGTVAAKWQSNDDCTFMSSCYLECSANTDCDKTDSYEYQVTKVVSLDKSQVNCTEEEAEECTGAGDIVQTLTMGEPLGSGRFWASTTCSGSRSSNNSDNSTTSVWVVQAPTDECECATTFTYRELDSTGNQCSEPVFSKEMAVRNQAYCSSGLSNGMIAFIVIFILLLGVVGSLFLWHWMNKEQEKKGKPSRAQVERMTTMDLVKLAALIEVANNPEVDDSATKPHLYQDEEPGSPRAERIYYDDHEVAAMT